MSCLLSRSVLGAQQAPWPRQPAGLCASVSIHPCSQEVLYLTASSAVKQHLPPSPQWSFSAVLFLAKVKEFKNV